jgi:hypothetical protein
MKEYHGFLQRYHDGDDKGHWDILQRKGMKKMFKKTKLRWGEREKRALPMYKNCEEKQ